MEWSNERIGLSIDLPDNFACGDFQLRGDSHFVRAGHTRRTPARELPGPKTSQNCELERGELSRTVYHGEPSLP